VHFSHPAHESGQDAFVAGHATIIASLMIIPRYAHELGDAPEFYPERMLSQVAGRLD
jgi:hypothetical protein